MRGETTDIDHESKNTKKMIWTMTYLVDVVSILVLMWTAMILMIIIIRAVIILKKEMIMRIAIMMMMVMMMAVMVMIVMMQDDSDDGDGDEEPNGRIPVEALVGRGRKEGRDMKIKWMGGWGSFKAMRGRLMIMHI